MKTETAIIGTSLACLVAAYKIAERGEQVTLISNGGRWGGHFAGIETCGQHYDAGMAIVELTSRLAEEQPALEGYTIFRRNDVGRYVKTVENFLQEIVPLRIIDTPQSYYRASWNDDFLLCNKFEVFRHWRAEEKAMAIHELKNRDASDWRHASKKIAKQSMHECASYHEVSHYNHGAHVHQQLIEPFVNKLTAVDSRHVSAIYHRRLWSPMYYPNTIVEAIAGEIESIADTVIHYPEKGSFATFPQVLIDSLNGCDNATVVNAKVKSVDSKQKQVSLHNGEQIDYEHIAWGGKLFDAYSAFGGEMMQDYATRRANLTFAFFTLDSARLKKDFSILFVLDPDVHAYRVTNPTNCAGEDSATTRIMIEFNTDVLARRGVTPQQVRQQSITTLIQLGVIEDHTAVRQIDVKALPKFLPIANLHYNELTKINVSQLQEYHHGLALIGDSSGMSTRSFADNIVQGLKYAECRKS